MSPVRSHFFRAFLILLVLGAVALAACVVRSHPGRSRHTVQHHDHGKHAKHKKAKKHKKHK